MRTQTQNETVSPRKLLILPLLFSNISQEPKNSVHHITDAGYTFVD